MLENAKDTQLDQNPMAQRVLQFASKNGKVDFEKFVQILEINQQEQEEEKLKFLFGLYSTNQDKMGNKVINQNDIFTILKQIVGGQLDDEKLNSVVLKTICELDSDGDQMITYDEFKTVFEGSFIQENTKNKKIERPMN